MPQQILKRQKLSLATAQKVAFLTFWSNSHTDSDKLEAQGPFLLINDL